MPTSYLNYRKSTSSKRYLVDIRLGRYKSYNDLYIKYNLRITFKEFEKLAATRAYLLKKADSAEKELNNTKRKATRLISKAYKLVAKA